MQSPVKSIAIVQGAENAAIQLLLRDFVDRMRGSIRVAGLIETPPPEDARPRRSSTLQSIVDGRSYRLFQDLGAGSSSCGLDAGGVVEAGEAVSGDVAAGCDLVVLSKFGKLEAESRSGLIPAFAAAIEAGVPVLTSVSPKHTDAWNAFAAPLFVSLAPDAAEIDAWWRAVGKASPASA
jgi:hypothetical protein